MAEASASQTPRQGRSPRLTGSERREQVLDATLALVAREGFNGVTIDAVARAAGITRPIVYGHFKDLTGLLNALFDRESSLAQAQLTKVVPGALDPRPAIEACVDALTTFLEAVVDAPDRWRLVLVPIEGSPRTLQERIAADRASVREQLGTLLRAGLEREGIHDGVDVPLVTHTVQDVAEGMARLLLTEPDEYGVERMVAFAASALAIVLQ